MAKLPPSAALRRQLRKKIQDRIEKLQLTPAEAAEQLRFSTAQVSRLSGNQDIFSLDRLVDAADRIGITVRMTATRPYERG